MAEAATVYGYNQLRASVLKRAHGFFIKAVAIGKTVRNKRLGPQPKFGERLQQNGGGSQAVYVVVAININEFIAFLGCNDSIYSRLHVRQKEWVVLVKGITGIQIRLAKSGSYLRVT